MGRMPKRVNFASGQKQNRGRKRPYLVKLTNMVYPCHQDSKVRRFLIQSPLAIYCKYIAGPSRTYISEKVGLGCKNY
jgi:hypothetical protein